MAAAKLELKGKMKACKAEIAELAVAVNNKLKENMVKSEATADGAAFPKLKVRRKLEAHFGKVVGLCWVPDSDLLFTGGMDGNLILWDAAEKRKKSAQQLKSPWLMFCEAYDKDVCCTGGLDNECTVWNLGKKTNVVLGGADGYICDARWVDGDTLLTASGDGTCALWHLNKLPEGKDVDMRGFIFEGHDKDVTSLDFKCDSKSEFATSSTDGSMMLWSVGSKGPSTTMRLWADKSGGLVDVNKIKFQAGGVCLGAATEASGAFLYDTRTLGPVNTFSNASPQSRNVAKVSCTFSKSGRLMFVGSEDGFVEIWDTLAGDSSAPIQAASIHENRVTEVATCPSGQCVASASWDTLVAISAP